MKAKCSKCGREYEVRAYPLINVASDPELKARVRDGSIFVGDCPYCGARNLLKYESLYHDPAEHLMIWLLPDGAPAEEKLQAISDALRGELGNYTLRRVHEAGELMEKINIFNAGLDDAVMEMCKYITRMELSTTQKDASLRDVPMKFSGADSPDHELIFSYFHNGGAFTVNVGFNVYEDCRAILSRNSALLPGTPFPCIDAEWVTSVIR
ncbi:MAG: CpXC domain-containing protein [Bacteroidales bacterium]|nr:CpXC domain-containing protein [Bacteroidales bacterium]